MISIINTKEELASFLEIISRKLDTSDDSYLHSMLALNYILRQQNATVMLDENLKQMAREVWKKIQSAGITLKDPPILFDVTEADQANLC